MSHIDFPKIYNPANQTKEELIANFVVRTKVFTAIFEDIRNADMNNPCMHYVIQGIRGQGKTTMLLRIAYEIRNHEDLMVRMIPVVFNEEQYHISHLYKLWETVAEYLAEEGAIPGLYDRMQALTADDDYEMHCCELLIAALQREKKKLILFVDNIDQLFTKFTAKEHQRLREVFTECTDIRLIGASAVSLEFHWDYSKPFYQFFKIVELKGLNSEETTTLLLKIGELYKSARVREIVEQEPGRVEALRRITSGVIRTIVLLFEIFVDDVNGSAFRDLERILDLVTPLYKHRMDNLSSQQQEIVDFIALSWDAVAVKEIAAKIKMESKAVSAQLQQLEKYHIVEKEKTATKNHLYRIQERFFNIWYLMRLGRKWDEKRIRFFVEFLDAWCDKRDLKQIASRHLAAIKAGSMQPKQALYVTEALIRTEIPRELQHELSKSTKEYLIKCDSEFKDYVSDSDQMLAGGAVVAFEDGKCEEAVEKLESIKNRTPGENNSLGICYAEMKEFHKAKECFLNAIKKGDSKAMVNLGFLYQIELKDNLKAEKYYLMAVEKGDSDAMNSLSWLYFEQKKQKKLALNYITQCVEKGLVENYSRHTYAMVLLWNNEILKSFDLIYEILSQPNLAEDFFADIKQYLLLLLAKKQYHLCLKLFTENPHNIKDRFKPVYFSLMYFLQDEYPNEYLRMGSEFKETVTEIIQLVQQWEQDYA